MKFFLGHDYIIEDTKMVSRLRDFEEVTDFHVNKVPSIFEDFHHIDSFYRTKSDAYDLLDRFT